MTDINPQLDPGNRHAPLGMLDVVRHLDWRDEALAVAIIVAETFPVWLVASLILRAADTNDGYPFWIVLMLLLVPHFILHVLEEWRIFSPDFEIITGVSIVVTTLIAIKFASFPNIAVWDPSWLRDTAESLAFVDNTEPRAVWGTVVLSIYGWWRARFREEPSIDSAFTMLRWGSFALAIILVVILIGAPEGSDARKWLSIGTIGFFAASLGAIGIARLKLEGFRTAEPLGPRWLATFVTPILVVIVLGIIAAGIFSRRFFETVVWLLTPVFFVLQVVFQVIIIIIAVLAFLILTPIFWLIGDRTVLVTSPEATATIIGNADDSPVVAPEPFQLPDPLRYLVAAIFLFVIISALTKFFFRRRGRRRESTDEERESVLDWGDLIGSAGNRLRNLFTRKPRADPFAALRGLAEWRYTLRIRELYLQLQDRGDDAGRARRDSETAEEYRPAVSNRFSGPANVPGAIDELTSIYREARYSGVPATEQDAAAAGEAWDEIEHAPFKPAEDS